MGIHHFTYDVSQRIEKGFEAVLALNKAIATNRPEQRLLLATLYGRGQDHPRPLAQAPLPLNRDVMEEVAKWLASSRACPGYSGRYVVPYHTSTPLPVGALLFLSPVADAPW